MKQIVIFLIAAGGLLAAGSLAAQESAFSPLIPGLRSFGLDAQVMNRPEKDSVRMVMELWKQYIESFTSLRFSERDRRAMWVDGSEDYLAEFDDGNLLYATFRKTSVLDIRKLNGGTYEIIVLTRSNLPGEYENWVESVYRVCAMAVAASSARISGPQNPFRLCNWLDAVIPTLRKQETRNVDWYASFPAIFSTPISIHSRRQGDRPVCRGQPLRSFRPFAGRCRSAPGGTGLRGARGGSFLPLWNLESERTAGLSGLFQTLSAAGRPCKKDRQMDPWTSVRMFFFLLLFH